MPVATEQQFAILSPILGEREDMPSVLLDQAFSPDSENVFLYNGEVRRMRGRAADLLDSNSDAVATPDGNPVIKYWQHKSSAGVEYLFGYTAEHVYLWDSTDLEWDLMHTCASACTHWSVCSINGVVISTNYVDKVQVWDDSTPGTAFAPLDSASGLDLDGSSTYLTAAKYVYAFEGYVFFGWTVEGGTTYPSRIRWCTYNDETDYDETGSGDTGSKDFPGKDHLAGFGEMGTTYRNLVVFKSASIYRLWITAEAEVINTALITSEFGLLAPDSIVYDFEGMPYFLATDYTIRPLVGQPISGPKNATVKNINPSYAEYSTATRIDQYSQLCWSIPYGQGAESNNKVLYYDLVTKIWFDATWPVRAFGRFSRQTAYTIDTIPFDSIDEIGWPTIDTVENVAGFPLDICSDYSGYTYDLHGGETDDSDSYTGKLILTTDLAEKRALHLYKRIHDMRFYFFRETSGSAIIEAKGDTAGNWESTGTVDLTDSDLPDIVIVDVSCDIRCRHLLLKVSATSAMRFIGVIFRFDFDGDR